MSKEEKPLTDNEQPGTGAADAAQEPLTPLEKFLYERIDRMEVRLVDSLERLSSASTRLYDAQEAAEALREERICLIEDRLAAIEEKLGLERRPDTLPRKRPNKMSIH